MNNSQSNRRATSVPVVEVREPEDIATMRATASKSPSIHVYLPTEFPSSELKLLESEGKIYGVFVREVSAAAEAFMVHCDTLPIFVVESYEAASVLAGRLERDPFKVVLEAVNGQDVVLRYLEGAPS